MAGDIKNISENVWTEEEIKYICTNVFHVSYEEMEKRLGRPKSAIKTKLKKLYKQGRVNNYIRKWTKHEDDFILEHHGELEFDKLCAKIFRTRYAVYKRMYALVGEARINSISGDYMVSDLMVILGRTKQGVKLLFGKNGFEMNTYGKAYVINPDTFWEWMSNEANHKFINAYKIEYEDLYHCPDWYKDLVNKLKKEYYSGHKKGSFTSKERVLAVNLKNKGYTYREIGKELNRTRDSVESFFRNLRKCNVAS